tara:strand:+ start:141 stop:626 length:486 start_codon:yes stop_codon:yes gene_type:complete
MSIEVALETDIALGSRCVPPHIGNAPSEGSFIQKEVVESPMRISQQSAISKPPEKQAPLITPTTGTLKDARAVAGSGTIDVLSNPSSSDEQKSLSAVRSTTTRADSFSRSSKQASVNALAASALNRPPGKVKVMTRPLADEVTATSSEFRSAISVSVETDR